MKNTILSIAICCLTVSAVTAADRVTRLSDNTAFTGTIDKATKTEIVIKSASGRETTIPVSDVARVQFDREPTELIAARANERSGAFETALQKYQEIQKGYNNSDKRLAADLKFLIARTTAKIAATDESKLDEAARLMGEFRNANADNFRYLEATLLHARILAASASPQQAQPLLAEVQSAPVKGYQLQAGVALGHLKLKADQIDEALQAFTDVVNTAQGDDSTRAALFEGLLGKAACYQKQNSFGPAIDTLDRIVQEAAETQTETLASAYLLKGDCLRAQNQPKAALMAYLHVDVLYPGQPIQHSEALYRLSELWGPAGYADRAAEAAARLTARYPQSKWAKM